MHLKDLKSKTPSDLLKIAEDLKIENAGTLRKQDMIFSILKQMALNNDAIYGEGVLEILQDGLGGSAKTLMFVNASPADYNMQETMGSFEFALRCKEIKYKSI